jgi:hypothetical protein
MVRHALLAALLGLAGCTEGTPALTDSPPSPPSPPCVTKTQSWPAADALLSNPSPDLNFGTARGMVLSSANGVGAFKFSISTFGVPANAQIHDIQLVLNYPRGSGVCGTDPTTSCGLCDALERDGEMQLYFLASDWDETGVTWNSKMSGVPWMMPGAQGPGDRSSLPAASAFHVSRTPLTFVVDPARLNDFALWRTAEEISFVVVPLDGAMVVTTHESINDLCNGLIGYPAPQLSITYCP